MNIAARATGMPEPYIVPSSKQFDGNDGYWSTFVISVGTPGQDFRVLPSTKGSVTYLIAPEGCIAGVDPDDCDKSRGANVFNSAQNIGFQTNVSTSWSNMGQYELNLENALNYTGTGLFGLDRVHLGPAAVSTSLQMDRQIVAGIASLDYYMGVLPLGTAESSFSSLSQSTDSLLIQLRTAYKIPSLSYGYTAGAKYRSKSVFGNLILGGYDSTRFTPSTTGSSFTFSNDPSKLLTVGVDSILATNTLRGTFSLTAGAHFSVIDSTVPHLWLPRDVCEQFESAFGLTYDAQTDLYLVNDTIHAQLLSNNPIITLKLINSLAGSSTDYTNIKLPYAAFDLKASYPYFKNATNYFPIRRAANETQFILGRTLLQEAYLIVDYERANFTIAQAVFPDPLPAEKVVTITPPDSPTESTSSHLSNGVIIGIAVSAAAILFLVAIFIFFWLRKRRARRQSYELANNNPVSDSGSINHVVNHKAHATPQKSSVVQEISGVQPIELATSATPYHDSRGHLQEHKMVAIGNNDEPLELHADSRGPEELHAESCAPVSPAGQVVTVASTPVGQYYEMDGQSSTGISRIPSEAGYGSNRGQHSGMSPVTR
jgi:hypothetical protein